MTNSTGDVMTSRNHTSSMPVTDGTGNDEKSGPGPAILYALLTAVVMVAALLISFIRYQRRRQAARASEQDYLDQFETILPGCSYHEMKISRARTIMTNTHLGYIPPATFNWKPSEKRKQLPIWDNRKNFSTSGTNPGDSHKPSHLEIPIQGYELTGAFDTRKITTDAHVHTVWENSVPEELDFPFADASETDIRKPIQDSGENRLETLLTRCTDETLDEVIHRNNQRDKGQFVANTFPSQSKHSSGSFPHQPTYAGRSSRANSSGYVVKLTPDSFSKGRRFSYPDLFPFPENEPVDIPKIVASDDEQKFNYYWERGLSHEKKSKHKRKKRLSDFSLPFDSVASVRDSRKSGKVVHRDKLMNSATSLPLLNIAYYRKIKPDDSCEFDDNFILLSKNEDETKQELDRKSLSTKL